MIFGILGKFRIDIGVQKNSRIFFSRWKNSQKIRNLGTFEALLNLYKELKHSLYKTYKGNVSIPYINSKVPRFWIFFDNFSWFFEIFLSRKKIPNIFWTPMSIQNFPKIPKITLIKPCGKFKDTKQWDLCIFSKKVNVCFFSRNLSGFHVTTWLGSVSC